MVVEKQLDCDLNKADYTGNKSMIEQSIPFHGFCKRQMQKEPFANHMEVSTSVKKAFVHHTFLDKLPSGYVLDGGTRIRRRRWLPWHFVRPGTSAAAEAPGPSGSARTGLLFGQPLADLCSQDGMLSQPMQDLLALLQEQGPSTEGIFRLAASERASREIREALDSGTEVHLASQPVHVLAVILKDFLRKIPSKLLVAEVYQQWMAALQKSSREERLVGLKECLQSLQKAQPRIAPLGRAGNLS
ncbi:hypothetical protein Q9233_003007 [Columba guinea]|nr:hypothetical protein Q9233_003007 [Columba guinea]